MVAEPATEETQAAPAAPDSTGGTPPSNESQGSVSPETAAPPAQGGETPAPEETPAAGNAKPLQEWTLEDFQAKVERDEPLTPTEVRRRDQLLAQRIQAEQDRRAAEASRLAEMRARDAERARAMEKRKADAKAEIARLDEMFAVHGGDPEDHKARKDAVLDRLAGEAAEARLEEHRYGIRQALLRLVGDTPANRDAVNARDLPDLVNDLYRFAYETGRKAGVPEGHVAKTTQEWEKEKKAAVSEALDDFKAKNPQYAPPSTASVTGVMGGKTYAQMTPEERSALTPEQRDALVAAQYRR